MRTCRLRPAVLEDCQQSPMDTEERDWLLYLANRALGREPWHRPTVEELSALAAKRGVNVARVLRMV